MPVSLRLRAALVPTLLLSACVGETPVTAKNESFDSVARRIGSVKAMRVSPGRWETGFRFVRLDLPGVPAAVRPMAEGALGANRTAAKCLTKAQLESSSRGLLAGKHQDCVFDTLYLDSGRIDAKFTCKVPDGTMHISLAGTYQSDRYKTTIETTKLSEGKAPFRMSMEYVGKRTGDCDGTERS